MTKIGVIGATGMIGHHVAKHINENKDYELIVIHRQTSNLSSIKDLKYEGRIADLNDADTLGRSFEGLDYVLNCGAYYPMEPKPLSEEIKLAEDQMNNFIAAVKSNQIKSALYLGGAIAIPKSENGIADEAGYYSSAPSNKAAYMQVKWLMDKMATDAGKSGVPIVIGIPPMTFGEYDYGPTTGRLIVHIVNRTLPGYVNGNRNVIYAGDAARGLLQACLKGRVGERYLITGHNISMEELVSRIVEVSGIQQMPKQVSLPIAKLLSHIKTIKYKIAGGELPLLNETAIAVMSAGQFLNGAKAKSELGYNSEVSIDDMIIRSIEWFREVGYIDEL